MKADEKNLLKQIDDIRNKYDLSLKDDMVLVVASVVIETYADRENKGDGKLW